jgi:hypothetical protein
MKTAKGVPALLDDCLGAAEAHAERFFGTGPVPRWRPAFRPAAWVAGMALAAAAAATLALAWTWSRPAATDSAEAVVVASGAPRVAAALTAEPVANAVSVESEPREATGCIDAACPTGPTPQVQPSAPGLPAADAPAWPTDPDAWALDPQTIAAPIERTRAVKHRVHNTPVVPDDSDPTPASDSQPDEDQGGGPVD